MIFNIIYLLFLFVNSMITISTDFLAGITSNPASPLTYDIAYSEDNGANWTPLGADNNVLNIEALSQETELEPFAFVGPDVEVVCTNKTGFWTNPSGTGLLDTGARILFRIRSANANVSTEWITHIAGPVDLATISPTNGCQVSFVVRGTLNLLDYYKANEATAVDQIGGKFPNKFNGWMKVIGVVSGHAEGLFPLTFDADKKTLQWNYGKEIDVPVDLAESSAALDLEDYLGNTLQVYAWQNQQILEAGTIDEWQFFGKIPEENITQWLLVKDVSGTLHVFEAGRADSVEDILQNIGALTGIDIPDHGVFIPVDDRQKTVASFFANGTAPIEWPDDINDLMSDDTWRIIDIVNIDSDKWIVTYGSLISTVSVMFTCSAGDADTRGGSAGITATVILTGYGLMYGVRESYYIHALRHGGCSLKGIINTFRVIKVYNDGTITGLSNDIDAFGRSFAMYAAGTYYLLKHTTLGRALLYRITALGTEGTPAHTETLTKNWTIYADQPCVGAACICNERFYVAAAEADTPSDYDAPPDAFGQGNFTYRLVIWDILNSWMYKINLPIDDIQWNEDNVYSDGEGLAYPVITKMIDGGNNGSGDISILATIGQVYRTGDYNDQGWELRNTKQKLYKINIALNVSTLATGTAYTGGTVNDMVFSSMSGLASNDSTLIIGKTIRFTSGSNAGMGTTIKHAELANGIIVFDNPFPTAVASGNTFIIEDFYVQKTVKEYVPRHVAPYDPADRSLFKVLGGVRMVEAKTITEDVEYELKDSGDKTIGGEIALSNSHLSVVYDYKLVATQGAIYEFNKFTQKPELITNIPNTTDGPIVAIAYDLIKGYILYATKHGLHWINLTGQNYDFATVQSNDFDDLSCRDVLHNLAVVRNAMVIPSEHSRSLTFQYRGDTLAFTDFTLAPGSYRYDQSYNPYFNYTGIEIDGYFLGTKDGLILSLTCGLIQPAFKRTLAIDILTKLYAGNRLHRVQTDWLIHYEPGDNGVLQINDETSGTPTTVNKNVMVLGIETDFNNRTHTLTLLEM